MTDAQPARPAGDVAAAAARGRQLVAQAETEADRPFAAQDPAHQGEQGYRATRTPTVRPRAGGWTAADLGAPGSRPAATPPEGRPCRTAGLAPPAVALSQQPAEHERQARAGGDAPAHVPRAARRRAATAAVTTHAGARPAAAWSPSSAVGRPPRRTRRRARLQPGGGAVEDQVAVENSTSARTRWNTSRATRSWCRSAPGANRPDVALVELGRAADQVA